MKKVERYQAKDGQLFVNRYDCEIYERDYKAIDDLEHLCAQNGIIENGKQLSAFILKRKEEILNILIENMKNDG